MPTNSSTSSTAKVILGCAKCGANMPDGAKVCPKCGNSVTLPAKEIPVVELPTTPTLRPHPKNRRRIFLWLFLAVIVATIAWVIGSDDPYAQGVQEFVGWKHDQTILETPFAVAAHSFRYYKFALPEGSTNVTIMGQFTVSADAAKAHKTADKDSDDNIEVYVLSEPSFAVWQNGYATSSVYESGKLSQGTVQSELPAGAGIYYLVFSNKFAPKTGKNVNATFLLRYKSWLPEWFRHLKSSLWNWLGV